MYIIAPAVDYIHAQFVILLTLFMQHNICILHVKLQRIFAWILTLLAIEKILSYYNSCYLGTIKWDIFTPANFHETSISCLKKIH